MKRLKMYLAFTACMLLITTNSRAQSWLDLFSKENVSKVVETLTGSSKVNMVGTWTYQGAAIELKSDDLLKKAGGAIASATLEKTLNERLNKLGVKAGVTDFTFKEDSTFTSTIGTRTMGGNYSYNASEQTVELKYASLVGLNAKVTQSSGSMSLLFDADALLKMLVYFGNKTTNSSIKAITTLAQGYDGMMMGLDFNKK